MILWCLFLKSADSWISNNHYKSNSERSNSPRVKPTGVYGVSRINIYYLDKYLHNYFSRAAALIREEIGTTYSSQLPFFENKFSLSSDDTRSFSDLMNSIIFKEYTLPVYSLFQKFPGKLHLQIIRT